MVPARAWPPNPSCSSSTTARFTSARPPRQHWRPAPIGSPLNGCPSTRPSSTISKWVWHDLKAFNLAHRTFTDVDTLDAALHSAVAHLNTERNRDLLGEQRISA